MTRRLLTVRPASAALLALAGLLLVGMALLLPGLAASNSVPASGLLDTTVVLTGQQLKPQDCNGLTLTTYLLAPGGSFNNNGASALILGGSGFDNIRAGGGNDCVVGGAGGDRLRGGGGSDVCFGDPSATFTSCAQSYTTLRP